MDNSRPSLSQDQYKSIRKANAQLGILNNGMHWPDPRQLRPGLSNLNLEVGLQNIWKQLLESFNRIFIFSLLINYI